VRRRDRTPDRSPLAERAERVAGAGAQIEDGVARLDRHPREDVFGGVPVPVLHAAVLPRRRPLVELLANAHTRVNERAGENRFGGERQQ